MLNYGKISTPVELLQVALALHNLSAQTVQGFDPVKVFPQFNREKSLFAYACYALFQGRKDLSEKELQQAREFVKPLNDGFRELLGQLMQNDTLLKAKMDSEATFNSKTFFERTRASIDSDGITYAIAVKRYEVQGKWVTALVFIPQTATTLGTPTATQANVGAYITPAQAIAQGNVPPVANGVHAPASM